MVFRATSKLGAGWHHVDWEGSTSTGERPPAGLYMAEVRHASASAVAKIVRIAR